MQVEKSKNIIVAITGASGAIYAKLLLQKLALTEHCQYKKIAIILSDTAREVWEYELKSSCDDIPKIIDAKIYSNKSFDAPFASGSSDFDTMIVIPCTMGTLGRIANGFADDLIARAADVVLKERRKLILVTRETPLNLIHIENMRAITLADGIICPANPSFYTHPANIEELTSTVVDRVLTLAGLNIEFKRWGDEPDV